MSNHAGLADRYTALWNEPDAGRRSELVRELWADDGVHVLADPPQEVREAAARLAFPVPPLEVRGHQALDARVTRAYEMFIEPGEHVFEAAAEPVTLRADVVAVRWAMVETGTGKSVGGGLDVLRLDGDGRIRTDHQFIDGS
ncbi:hypothetical protein DZF91_17655 [Actinomadura logoneensis]|uniref:SnoaL-like domain-containing protein n=1 Tax=Actinomadura logoneensis TaxID=2293572 RepID=A0A372JKK5_9ACTN|nr:hypothetical protein [Actinomadura logoneensis]RFU40336.1 hypothetical protein DZF91_17655 [Actinomadura logoneensis]